MSESTRRKLLLRDFAERKESAPEHLLRVQGYEWEYIAVQPMANETQILRQLGMSPSDCIAVDCYWCVDDDVVFLQLRSQVYLKERPVGLYAQWWPSEVPRLQLSAYLDEPYISQDVVSA